MISLKRTAQQIAWILAIVFIFLNLIAFFHAYKFTHFVNTDVVRTKSPEKLNSFEKIKTLIFGINNPRPVNKVIPDQYYKTVRLKSNKEIACWQFESVKSKKNNSVKGTVILFHGYCSEKSSMLEKSKVFLNLGYNTFLVDFMGSGGSEGNQTTLGFKEAEEVKTAYDFVKNHKENKVYLFGTSMGAVAIMKAIKDYKLDLAGVIIECPFGSMYKTTCERFQIMHLPTFPMAGLLLFWGGLQNGFCAFRHNPTEYAKKIKCPTLLLYGEQDKNVSRQEIDEIYTNLKGKKTLKLYKLAGHEDYLIKYKDQWIKDISQFLESN